MQKPSKDTVMALKDILEGAELVDFQTVDLLKLLYFRNNVLVYGTGMGKTWMAAAVMRGFLNEVPTRRFIYVVKANQLLQTPKKVRSLTGVKVLASSAAENDVIQVFKQQDFLSASILIISDTLLMDESFMAFLYDYKHEYYGIIIDEVHEFSNFPDSQSAAIARGMLRHFDFRLGLTATPVTSDPSQLARLAHMFDWETIDNVRDFTALAKKGDNITEYVSDMFIFRSREKEGIKGNYRSHVIQVPPHPWQRGLEGGLDMFEKTKGHNAVNQAEKVYEISQSELKGLKGLVFVHYGFSRKWLEEYLTKKGLRVGVIYGRTTRKQRDEILKRYANHEYDLLLTSVTTALDIDSDYVIFYEYTGNIQQMLGRAERGLNPKTLDLFFIFTQETGEAEYFLRNIYEISFWIQQVLSQDYSTLLGVGNTIKSRE